MTLRNSILIPLFMLSLSACATTQENQWNKISTDQLKDQGIIVGQILPHETKTGNVWSFNTRLENLETGKKYYVSIDKKSDYFAWRVPPGYYNTSGLTLFGDGKSLRLNHFLNGLKVRAGEVVYIGHITYEIGEPINPEGNDFRGQLKKSHGVYPVHVKVFLKDRHEETKQKVAKVLKNKEFNFSVQLFKLSPA